MLTQNDSSFVLPRVAEVLNIALCDYQDALREIKEAVLAKVEQAEAPILRDRIAVHALQGMLAHSRGNPPHGYRPMEPTMFWMDAIATEAYGLADAMLVAREGE